MTLHSTSEAAALSGATFRQLDYWARTGVIAAASPAQGSGSRRRWSDEEVRALSVLARVAAVVHRDTVHDLLVATVNAAMDNGAGFEDVWIDLGDGISLVVEPVDTERTRAVAS